jgi:serine phosphatase RsbU (regulator of sigma subunit)
LARILGSFAPFVAFLPWSKLQNHMKPLAALCMIWGIIFVGFYFVRLSSANVPGLPDLAPRWIITVNSAQAFAALGVILGLLTLLFRDQQRIAKERALLAGELHAACEIQRMLAPAAVDCAAGLQIEVAFHPMREVGGDFYLCRVLPGGRQRVLLGDVSGKGSAAAMTAALLLGRATDCDDDTPATVLSSLNRVLVKSRVGGFATCLCADIAADGRVTIANAGHLPPYCGGDELKTDSALPLGVAADATYTESSFALSLVDTLTFLSDGVVEAQSPAGELFGFERTRAISGQTAEEIAATAKRFGQQDDITVLTLGFAHAEVAHA